MPKSESIEKLLGDIRAMKAGNAFKTFIDYIVFPRYRNISPNTRIDFAFPLTVLVGQNGSGKTAVLQALYGAPSGFSVGRWWFETAVDPIEDAGEVGKQTKRSADLDPERRSAFYYGYKHQSSKDQTEHRYVVKTRIKRPNDPDNWEPSRPLVRYGLKTLPEGIRYDPIEMTPIYVNFKLNVSAFDKCFYFFSGITLTEFSKRAAWLQGVVRSKSSRKQPRIQDYLRNKSKRLKRVLDQGNIQEHAGKHALNKTPRSLKPEELQAINWIIGKNYTSGKVVEHRFFEGWGTTVAFSTSERNYTDAFAGSGEGAVVRLVLEVEGAKEGSLVLLDEPETSLHPGAQERILQYLLEKIKSKRLQIVVSTHSPTLVGFLPPEAIKVFSLNAQEFADVLPNCHAEEAFFFIGHRYDARINVIVEDRLAKVVVEAAIMSVSKAFADRFNISYGPGGESSLKQEMAIHSRSIVKPTILFDGDQKPSVKTGQDIHIDTKKIASGDLNPEYLINLITEQTNTKIKFAMNSNMPESTKVSLYIDYLNYYYTNVEYLPFNTPEEAIWDDDACQQFLEIEEPGKGAKRAKQIISIANHKLRFARLAEMVNGLDAIHCLFVKRFSHTKSDQWEQLVALMKKIGDKNA